MVLRIADANSTKLHEALGISEERRISISESLDRVMNPMRKNVKFGGNGLTLVDILQAAAAVSLTPEEYTYAFWTTIMWWRKHGIEIV